MSLHDIFLVVLYYSVFFLILFAPLFILLALALVYVGTERDQPKLVTLGVFLTVLLTLFLLYTAIR